MPITDSIATNLADSLAIISDSLAKLHSLDSIQLVATDSLQKATTIPTGFEGKALPETLNNNPILTISLLLLFLLFGYVINYGRKMIVETTKDFFYLKERSSIFIDSSANALPLKISFVIISIGSIGLFLYSLFFHEDTSSSFQNKLVYLALFFLLTISFFAFKLLTFKSLGYIFFDKSTSSIFIRDYFSIIFGLGIVLLPVVIGLIYTDERFFMVFLITGLILFLCSLLLILYKIFQIFLVNLYSLFYILLYLCTLEILPIVIVIKALL